ncbi:cytidylate kinase-like family protein [Actinomadura miaoliensis]|uniref:Cytidylate kinase-like family protein n=1 Tax=Actinomadura miaoliensis TaxID=430685 RepID=A0ABP7WZP6_9ACTN
MAARVVTLSATFGAGGAAIGHAVAGRLGLPFVDRAVPVAVAAEIGCSLEEALAHDDRAESGIGRLLVDAARLPGVSLGGMDVSLPERGAIPEEEFVTRTEEAIRRVAHEGGGVVLGRAGALVLAHHPRALHVRLDGSRQRRLARARARWRERGGRAGGERAEQSTMTVPSERDVERILEGDDRARAAYVKHFYGADPADPRLYHLLIDSTRIPEPTVVELVVTAALAF